MSNFQIVLFTGGIITIALSLYACILAFKLKDRQSKKSQPVEFEPKSQSQLDAQQSVRVIAQALLQNDLTPTEAAMRIGFLAQQFSPSEYYLQSIQSFRDLAMDTSHLPILEDWKALSSTDKDRLEKQRLSIEKSHAQAIIDAAKILAKIP